MKAQDKLVIDFSNFIITTDCISNIWSVSLDATNCRLLLNTTEGNKVLGIEPLVFNECPYQDTVVIGGVGISREQLRECMQSIDRVNWLGIMG
jgi:hypothetical protein